MRHRLGKDANLSFYESNNLNTHHTLKMELEEGGKGTYLSGDNQ
jgi:hypothetical protein